jgi:hypothetical protein
MLETQFAAGRLYAVLSSRPGQVGRADGYILEGRELEVCIATNLFQRNTDQRPVLPSEAAQWQAKAQLEVLCFVLTSIKLYARIDLVYMLPIYCPCPSSACPASLTRESFAYVRVVTMAGCCRVWPWWPEPWVFGLLSPSRGRVEPRRVRCLPSILVEGPMMQNYGRIQINSIRVTCREMTIS